MQEKRISDNVIRRLPRYLRKLEELQKRGVEKVSSFELGRALGLTASQIRQDLNCFGEFGLQGYGYNVQMLRERIAIILGMGRGYRAILIGVGNIGRSLIDKFSFENWGYFLDCTFDVDPDIIGQVINGIQVHDINVLPAYLSTNRVDVAVLCVSKDAAVDTARLLEKNGVKAIWNFTNVDVAGPESDLLVENVHFSDSLLALSYYLTQNARNKDLNR
ncbi:MAG: redox-sensing transcriptional repressor Rex [Oscillospiraceae bacterium]|nr:redox-sensing transcriptional repressor Rex [Oscillospiraceae bacterium]